MADCDRHEWCQACPCQDHSHCAGMLHDAFVELGWDVTVSTEPPPVVNVWTTDPFVCPHGVEHWAEPTGELAELVTNREANREL